MSEEQKLEGQDLKSVERLRAGYETIRAELGKVIVGQEQVIDEPGEGVRRVVYRFQLEALFERPPAELIETVPLFNATSAGR